MSYYEDYRSAGQPTYQDGTQSLWSICYFGEWKESPLCASIVRTLWHAYCCIAMVQEVQE